MRPISGRFGPHFPTLPGAPPHYSGVNVPVPRPPMSARFPTLARLARLALAACLLPLAAWAAAADDEAFHPDEALVKQVSDLARGGASQLSGAATATGAAAGTDAAAAAPAGGVRVEVEVGRLDPRLRLAPCQKIQPYLPAGTPLWGASRVGLRCVQGPKAWNVSLPVTVHVWGRATVVATNLAPGTVLAADMLSVAEVDLAAAPGAAVADPATVVGRTLARPLATGSALRQTDLKARQWFAAGETVRVLAVGPGWQVVTEAQAVSPGIEGQVVRVRTESGRLLTARPTGERQVELAL